MKLGWRSQSWYIISQKHDMIAIQASSRRSRMFVIVRHSTWPIVSVFEAPEGTSLKVNRSSRLKVEKKAEARNRLRHASLELAVALSGPGSTALSVSRIEGR
jgi:hypothetical protein